MKSSTGPARNSHQVSFDRSSPAPLRTSGALLCLLLLLLGAPGTGCYVDFGGGEPPDPDAEAPDGQARDGAPPDAAPSDAVTPVDAAHLDAAQMDAGPSCGDGVVDPGEDCDDGLANSDSLADHCRSNCMLPWCGDGVTDTGEQCDNGPGNSNTIPDACRTTCTNPGCGDGVIDSGEQCDDGNNGDTDACRNTCVSAFCGDHVVWVGTEDCDDGGTVSGDGCSASCQDENLPSLTYLSTLSGGWSTPWVMTFAGEPHAPTTTVRAAVAIEDAGLAMLFTQTTYHVLEIPSLNWYDSGSLAADFSQVPGSSLRAGYGRGTGATTSITLIAGYWAYVFDYTNSSGNISFTQQADLTNNDDWQTPEAPDTTLMTGMWLDMSNDHGWVTDSLLTACGVSGTVVSHSISMTASSLHVQEIGNCFDFYDQMSISAFAPFGNSVSGRPTFSQIRGTFYFDSLDRLFVVTQQ